MKGIGGLFRLGVLLEGNRLFGAALPAAVYRITANHQGPIWKDNLSLQNLCYHVKL